MQGEQRSGLASALARLERALLLAARDYLRLTVEGEAAGLATLKQLWRGGLVNWPGLVALLVAIVAVPYLRLHRADLPVVQAELWEGEAILAPSLAPGLSLLLSAVGWAYVLAAAGTLGLIAHVVAAAYAIHYCLPAGFGLPRSGWLAILPLWTLILGGWVASSRRERWRLPLLLALSLVTALVLYPSLGLRAALPPTPGRLILAGLSFALIANPCALRQRRYRPGLAFAVTLGVLSVFFGACLLWQPSEELLGATFLSIHDLSGVVALFWCWMGLDLVGGARSITGWIIRSARALLPERALAVASAGFWVLWSAIACALVHYPVPPVGLARFLMHHRWGESLLQVHAHLSRAAWSSPALVDAADYHLYLVLLAGSVALGLCLVRRLSLDRLLNLSSLLLLSFFILWGYTSLFYASAQPETTAGPGLWPLLAFVAGMSWQVLKASSQLVEGGHGARSLLFLGFLAFFGGASLLELSTGYGMLEEELSLNLFVGATCLGLPYLLYSLVRDAWRSTRVSGRRVVLLFCFGLVSAIPSLISGRTFFAPLVWSGAVLFSMRRGEGGAGWWDGLVSALSVARGFMDCSTRRVRLPFASFLRVAGRILGWQVRYASSVIWPWQGQWWRLLGGVTGAAAILGLLLPLARSSRGPVRVALVGLAPALSMAFLAAWELVLGTR